MKTTISEFYCVECGKKGIPIARKLGAQREAGHLKSLWCVYCQKQTNHAEIRPFGTYTVENFKEEFYESKKNIFLSVRVVFWSGRNFCRNR